MSEAAQILAMITLHVSFASVLSTVLLIRRVAKRMIVYTAPFVVAVVGLLLSTLPFIGCGERHIFPGAQMVCKSAVSMNSTMHLTKAKAIIGCEAAAELVSTNAHGSRHGSILASLCGQAAKLAVKSR